MLSGFIPSACPFVTSENDLVLRHTAGKSYFPPCDLPLSSLALPPE